MYAVETIHDKTNMYDKYWGFFYKNMDDSDVTKLLLRLRNF